MQPSNPSGTYRAAHAGRLWTSYPAPVHCRSAHSNLQLQVLRQEMAMRSPSAVALRLQARSLVRRWARGLSDSVTYDASSTDVEAMIEENLVSDTTSRRRRCHRCRRTGLPLLPTCMAAAQSACPPWQRGGFPDAAYPAMPTRA